ncbi:MAG: RNA polymerase sigma factor [Solirubrobacteraceae bacterium]
MTDPASNRPGDRLTEGELVDRAQAGDVEAFERLASAHTDYLFRVVVRLVGDRGDAEDIVQEALLRAWRGIGRFHGRSMFFTWLYRVSGQFGGDGPAALAG